jgi:hypothetical protein
MITIVLSCKKNGENKGTKKGFTKDTYEITQKKIETGKRLEERKELTRIQKKERLQEERKEWRLFGLLTHISRKQCQK